MKVDVGIIGAGPAGLATAVRARRSGYSVAVLSSSARTYRSAVPETLPGSARGHLSALDLFEEFQSATFPRHCLMASVWGNDVKHERHSICSPAGAGWYIDRCAFDAWMLRTISDKEPLTLVADVLREAKLCNSKWQLRVSKTDELVEASVVVDATGRASAFAQRIGVKRRYIDRQVCVTKAFPVHASRDALVESAPEGWWFSAPCSRDELGVAFYTDSDLLPSGVRSSSRFCMLLQGAPNTRARVEQTTSDAPSTQVASTSYLQEFAGDRWFAAGDAAIAYDPLASQGMLQALESAEHAHASLSQLLNGHEKQAIESYRDYQERSLQTFLTERCYYYTAEPRWVGSPFWQRRRAVSQKQMVAS